MSDFDQTMISGREPQASYEPPQPTPPVEPPQKKNKMLIFGGIGCVVLLCLALAVGGGAYYFMGSEGLASLTGGGDDTPATVEIIPTEELPEPAATEETAATVEIIQAEEPAATDEPTATEEPVSGPPEIGPITFALGATEDFSRSAPPPLLKRALPKSTPFLITAVCRMTIPGNEFGIWMAKKSSAMKLPGLTPPMAASTIFLMPAATRCRPETGCWKSIWKVSCWPLVNSQSKVRKSR